MTSHIATSTLYLHGNGQPWEVTRYEYMNRQWAGDPPYGIGQNRDMHVVSYLFCEAVMSWWLEQGLHVVRPTWKETKEGPDE